MRQRALAALSLGASPHRTQLHQLRELQRDFIVREDDIARWRSFCELRAVVVADRFPTFARWR